MSRLLTAAIVMSGLGWGAAPAIALPLMRVAISPTTIIGLDDDPTCPAFENRVVVSADAGASWTPGACLGGVSWASDLDA